MEPSNKGKIQLPDLGQVGIVVCDLDKAIDYYSSTFGIGPWRVYEIDASGVEVRGRKCQWKGRAAFTYCGPVELELIQVISGDTIHAEFINQGREGLHHLGFFVGKDEMDTIIQSLEEEGIGIIQRGEGKKGGGRYAYFDPDKVGGVILELIYRPPD